MRDMPIKYFLFIWDQTDTQICILLACYHINPSDCNAINIFIEYMIIYTLLT